MGLLRRLLGLVDAMRVDIFMEYQSLIGSGSAAVEWLPLASNDPNLRPFLVGLLYARVLAVDTETRAKLFWTIDDLSKRNVRDEGRTGFQFPDWTHGHVCASAKPSLTSGLEFWGRESFVR